MKRRGSYWSGILDGMIDRFETGMMVEPVIVKRQGFCGTVTEVNKPENKVYVAWGDGAISQEDPDMIMPSIMNMVKTRRQSLPRGLENKYRTVAKELEPIPKESKQASRRSIYSSDNGKVYRKTVKGIMKK